MRHSGLYSVAFAVVGVATFATGQLTRQPSLDVVTATLSASRVAELAKTLSSPQGAQNSFPFMDRLLYDGPTGSLITNQSLTAFEENRYFIYALGTPAAFSTDRAEGKHRPSRLIRRVIVLRPSIYVVDNELAGASADVKSRWRIEVPNQPSMSGNSAATSVDNTELSWRTLLPRNADCRLERAPGTDAASTRYFVDVVPPEGEAVRFLTVFFQQPDHRVFLAYSASSGEAQLTLHSADRVFHLNLPPPVAGVGDIMVLNADGKSILLEKRPLPSGVLPHGPEGSRLLELWDADYRGQHPPIWDIGHPADELKRVISSGKIPACRALDLCCGSGNDAIYLASQHFDVTALDVAPTAIAQAEQKAARAGVSVHWLLADVLNPPALEPFDFIYDRGCYHVVRDQNLDAYLATLRRFSHPGTQFLLLASQRGHNASGDGTTGVTEEELNFDFLPLFEIEWLRPYRLESNQPGAPGPPAWSALMSRKP